MVFEPNAHDGELFHTNAFSFAARRRVCQLAWRNTIDDLRLRADELRPVLAANGIRLRDEVLDDDSRTLLDGLAAPPPPSTDTTARLRRALDATERVIARRTTTRKRAPSRCTGRRLSCACHRQCGDAPLQSHQPVGGHMAKFNKNTQQHTAHP